MLKNKFLEVAKRQYRLYPGEAWESWPEPAELPRYLVEPETPTAQAFWLRVDLLPSGDAHTFGRFIQLCDATEQITTQRDMRTFHSIVEHKLRTPLGHMQKFLDLIQGRIAKHQLGEIEGYTSTRLPVKLLFSEEFPTRDEALACEQQIKGWSRRKKEAMMQGDWVGVSQLARRYHPSRASG